jgi:hypothetical protein
MLIIRVNRPSLHYSTRLQQQFHAKFPQFHKCSQKQIRYLCVTKQQPELQPKKLPHKGMVVSALKEINEGILLFSLKICFKNLLHYTEECRVSLTPSAASLLIKRGINVQVEKGAGTFALISDEDFSKIGVKIVDRKDAMQADVILKVGLL